jgi:predicted MPP superfamily phosphohydrolase
LLRGKSPYKTWVRVISLALLAAPFLVALWAFGIEPGMLVVRHLRMELPGWRSDLKIAVLSDLHVGSPHVGLDKLQRIVRETNAEHPALIVLLGDFVIGGPRRDGRGVRGGGFVEPEPIAEELKKLRAPLGVYAVLGNHDWWYDGERVGKALTDAGIQVLENKAVHVGQIWLGGIADLWTRDPDIAGTLGQVTGNDPVVLMAHNPDIFPEVPTRVSLTLAAHTHGGQVNLPVVGRVVTTSLLGYTAGEYVEHGRHLFVTTGIGTSIMPVRLGVPPEIVILTLSGAKTR